MSRYITAVASAPAGTIQDMELRERTMRGALYFAGAWNILGGAIALLDPPQHFAQAYSGALQLQDPLQLFFFRATWINVMAWGIGYLLAGRFPGARIPILSAGATGKIAYCTACLALVQTGVGNSLLATAAILDLAFAAVFAAIAWADANS